MPLSKLPLNVILSFNFEIKEKHRDEIIFDEFRCAVILINLHHRITQFSTNTSLLHKLKRIMAISEFMVLINKIIFFLFHDKYIALKECDYISVKYIL